MDDYIKPGPYPEKPKGGGNFGQQSRGFPTETWEFGELKQAESAVAVEWKPGEVILNLYEVMRVKEGFGSQAVEKDYHEGGFGRVYRAFHRTWRREMAVKTPRADKFVTQKQKTDFTVECETWVNLGLHPHVAACHYVRELGGVPRVFSEYADAGTLKDWVKYGRLYQGSQREVLKKILDLAVQFAWGLHYAHERGVVHQDVKPLNALMWSDGTLKVADFGLARARQRAGVGGAPGRSNLDGGTVLVSSGAMTPAYCSPEQAAGEKLSRRTDIWSWAVSVLEMFTGDVTWYSGVAAGQVLEDILQNGFDDEAGWNIPAMPEGVVCLLRRCFQLEPEARPQTLQECVSLLVQIYQHEFDEVYPWPEPQAAGDTAAALNNRALSFLDIGMRGKAEDLFLEALELDKNHLAATYNMGLTRWRSGKCHEDDLLQSLEETKRGGARGAEWAQGWVRIESGYFAEARRHFAAAISRDGGEDAQEGLEVAEALEKAGAVECLHTFNRYRAKVNAVAFSPDGRYALSGRGRFMGQDNTLALYDVNSRELLYTLQGHEDIVTSVAFSPDGCRILSGSRDSTLKVWDLAAGSCLQTLVGHGDCVNSVASSPDGQYALSGSSDRTLKLWTLATGQCSVTFSGHAKAVTSVAFSPDGRFALSGSQDQTLKLWGLATGKCLDTLEGHTGAVHSVAYSPDGRYFLSGGSDKKLILWKPALAGTTSRFFRGHTDGVVSVSYSPDGRFVLSASREMDKTLRLWETATTKCLRILKGHSHIVTSAVFSPDGRRALSGGTDQNLKLWDLSYFVEGCQTAPYLYSMVITAKEAVGLDRLFAEHLSGGRQALKREEIWEALEQLKQARMLTGFERNPEALQLQAQLGAYARRKGLAGGWLKTTFAGHRGAVHSVALSLDGNFALSGSADKTLKLWEVPAGKCLNTLEGHKSKVSAAALSDNGLDALSGGDALDQTLRLWDTATRRCLCTYKFGSLASGVDCVAFSPGGHHIASCGQDLLCFEAKNWAAPRFFRGHTSTVECAAVSLDGRFALSGSRDKTVKLWEMASGRCLCTYEGHTGWINSVSLSPDGSHALSGSDDKTLKIWELSTGRCLSTLRDGPGELYLAVAYSPDGRYALSGGTTKALKLWNLDSGSCGRAFDGHTDWINSVAFSPDGRYALSGSKDMTLKLWELDWEYEFPCWSEWEEGAKPYLQNFLSLRKGPWTDTDFAGLLLELSRRGYGWIRPAGVARMLKILAGQ